MSSLRLIISFLLLILSLSYIQPTFSFRKIPREYSDAGEYSTRRSSSSRAGGSCWDAINEVDGCQDEIYTSLKTNEIEISYECCRVILHGLPPKCTDMLSSGGEFSPEFGGAVNEYCDGMGITPPMADGEDNAEER